MILDMFVGAEGMLETRREDHRSRIELAHSRRDVLPEQATMLLTASTGHTGRGSSPDPDLYNADAEGKCQPC